MTFTTNTPFAVITARQIDATPEDYGYTYQTCGHARRDCPSIKPTSRQLPTSTLGEYLADNEYFDGEVHYLGPFRCPTCHPDICQGGKCHSILDQCSKHSARYQARYGRAANE